MITGGAGEIGMAAARLFLEEGAKVLLVDLEDAVLEKAVQSLKSDSAAYLAAYTWWTAAAGNMF
ncbi:MAG: SDR family NAD(P)-dependent oxidoreductase [Candidatus Adiutricales bacterium]